MIPMLTGIKKGKTSFPFNVTTIYPYLKNQSESLNLRHSGWFFVSR